MRTFVTSLRGGVAALGVIFGHVACGQTVHEVPNETGSGGHTVGDGAGGRLPDEGDGDGDGDSAGGSGSSDGGTWGTSTGGVDGAATGGQGTGGVPASCPAIPAACEPNTEGCSDRGERYSCTECGQMDLQGQDCARLITSDKEGGFICVIRGQDELICVGGAAEWSEALKVPMQIQGFAVQLRLPDDLSSSTQTVPYCFIDEAGAISCVDDSSTTSGLNAPSGGACTDLSITDGPAVCGICSSTIACAGSQAFLPLDELNGRDAQAISLSDSTQLIWLDSVGKIHGLFEEEVYLPGTYASFFVDDEAKTCGLEPDGDLVCALDRASDETVRVAGPFVQGSAGSGGLRCAVREEGTIICLTISGGDVTPSFGPEATDFLEVAVSRDGACALTRTGSVVCWDREGYRPDWDARMNP